MKSASPALLALLATGNFVKCDLWTITLSGGNVVRWTSHDQQVSFGGNIYAKGPIIERGSVTEKVGLEVSTMEMNIIGTFSDLINGVPVIQFISSHGFDGSNVRLDRAFAADWSSPIVGSINKFSGRVTSVHSIKGAEAMLTVSSWMILLNAGAPRNLFQSGCLRTLYDAGCGLLPDNFKATGSASSGTKSSFSSSVSNAADYFSQGRVVFSTGPNAGVSRMIATYDGSGNFTVIPELPFPVSSGDQFSVYAGCDLAMGTCLSKFNNLSKFRGTPFVPLPTAALGSTTTTTTTGGK